MLKWRPSCGNWPIILYVIPKYCLQKKTYWHMGKSRVTYLLTYVVVLANSMNFDPTPSQLKCLRSAVCSPARVSGASVA